MAQNAMFAGLVVDEAGKPAQVAYVGADACYVVMDDDFKKHIDAAQVDRQVLRMIRELMMGQRDVAVQQALQMIGRNDIFTKAAVESSIDNMESAVGNPIPEEARRWMAAMGFRVMIDSHGTVVDFNLPGGVDEGDE